MSRLLSVVPRVFRPVTSSSSPLLLPSSATPLVLVRNSGYVHHMPGWTSKEEAEAVNKHVAARAAAGGMPVPLSIWAPEGADLARTSLLVLAGTTVVVAWALSVVAGEEAHEAAHPHYSAPYDFSARRKKEGAHWWPGRHCQFFEFNCFAAAYENAEEKLKQLKEGKRAAIKSKVHDDDDEDEE